MKLITLFLLINFFSFNLSAEIFDTAESLAPKTYSIGFEPEVIYDQEKLIGTIHISYGLVKNIDANIRVGMGINTIFTGLNLGYQLMHNKIFDFSSSFGYHYDSELFFDYIFNLSHNFKYFSVYNGLAFNYQLTAEKNIDLAYFLGAVFNLENNNKIIIETGKGLANYYNWISIGVASIIK